MRALSTAFALVLVVAAAASGAACSKEGKGTPTAADPGSSGGAAKTSGGGSGEPSRPKVAIGADRTEHFEIPAGAKKLADTKEFTLAVSAPAKVASGEPQKATVDVVPKKGWHLNEEFPPRLKVTPPEGVKVAKPNQAKADAVAYTKQGARWAVAFTAGSAGHKAFTGTLKFAVCTDTTCNPRTQQLAFAVDVE